MRESIGLECHLPQTCLITREELEKKRPNTGLLCFVSDSVCIVTKTPGTHVLLPFCFCSKLLSQGLKRKNKLVFPINILQTGVYTQCSYRTEDKGKQLNAE